MSSSGAFFTTINTVLDSSCLQEQAVKMKFIVKIDMIVLLYVSFEFNVGRVIC
jgi:hypothetical protein